MIEMGPTYFILSETPIEGFDLFGDAGALAQASDWLDQLAEAAGVRPLMDYFSMDPDEVDALFDGLDLTPEAGTAIQDPDDPDSDDQDDDDLDDSDPRLEPAQPEEWFTAEEGLTTIRALIAAVGKAPAPAVVDPFDPPPEAVLADLRTFESILEQLGSHEIRWHLGVDFGGQAEPQDDEL